MSIDIHDLFSFDERLSSFSLGSFIKNHFLKNFFVWLVQDAEVLLRLLRHPLDARLALGSEDPLFRKEAQRECQVLLPEVDGRSGLNFA